MQDAVIKFSFRTLERFGFRFLNLPSSVQQLSLIIVFLKTTTRAHSKLYFIHNLPYYMFQNLLPPVPLPPWKWIWKTDSNQSWWNVALNSVYLRKKKLVRTSGMHDAVIKFSFQISEQATKLLWTKNFPSCQDRPPLPWPSLFFLAKRGSQILFYY